jgi:hypothetical protein
MMMNAMNELMPKIEEMITKSGQDIKRIRNGIQNYMGANRSHRRPTRTPTP